MVTARVATPGFSPLDRELGLTANSPWSPRARQILVRMGTELPFAHGPALLALTSGLQVSASTMRSVTEAAGAMLVAVEEAECAQIERTLPDAPRGADRQQVSVDGAMVPLVGGGWREVRTMAVGTIDVSPTGDVMTGNLSYFSRMTDASSFSRAAIPDVHRRGIEHASVVAAVADGAPWCQSFYDDHMPGSIRILDYPHALEHLHTVAQAVFGTATSATTAWLTEQGKELRTGNPDRVLQAIATLPVEVAPDPAQAATIRDRELAYFTRRRDHIAYADFLAAGLPIGSGTVESANKLVVEARLKGAGMHWNDANINPMVALRCALKSDRWAERWAVISEASVRAPRRRRHAPLIPTAMPITPLVPETLTSADPPRRHQLPPTIVNRRPTANHPWKQGLRARPIAPST